MTMMIRCIEKQGFPIFQLVGGCPVSEKTDTLRLKNWAQTMFNNFKWAFKCHAEATDAVRHHKSKEGMTFGDLVGKMIVGSVPYNQLEDLKDHVSALLDKLNLDPNDENVKKLRDLCYVEHDPEKRFRLAVCTGV